jgi:hypothetical protein
MRKGRFIVFLLILSIFSNAQRRWWLETLDTNFFSISHRANLYFDSIRNIIGDSAMFEEGSLFSAYQRWYNFLAPRMNEQNKYITQYIRSTEISQDYHLNRVW